MKLLRSPREQLEIEMRKGPWPEWGVRENSKEDKEGTTSAVGGWLGGHSVLGVNWRKCVKEEGVVTCQLLLKTDKVVSVLRYILIFLIWGLNGEWERGSAPLVIEPSQLPSTLHLSWLCSLLKAFSFYRRSYVLFIRRWNLSASQVCLWTYSLLISCTYWMLKNVLFNILWYICKNMDKKELTITPNTQHTK